MKGISNYLLEKAQSKTGLSTSVLIGYVLQGLFAIRGNPILCRAVLHICCLFAFWRDNHVHRHVSAVRVAARGRDAVDQQCQEKDHRRCGASASDSQLYPSERTTPPSRHAARAENRMAKSHPRASG